MVTSTMATAKIILKGDLSDYVQDKYKAMVANKNKVLLELLCTSASYLKVLETVWLISRPIMTLDTVLSPRGHAVLRGQIANDDSQNIMLILLHFPVGTVLTMEHYATSKATGELNCKLISIKTIYNVVAKKVEWWANFIQWKVVLYEVKPHNICEASLREQLKGMMKQGCGD
jgi:hypothetical protein